MTVAFLVSGFVRFRQVGIFGETKLISENHDMTCFGGVGEDGHAHSLR